MFLRVDQNNLQLNKFFILIVFTTLIGLSVTAHKGEYIREKFGAVGVIYLDSGLMTTGSDCVLSV